MGTVSAACFADLGHDVICVDVDEKKVELISAGQTPVLEEHIGDLVAKNVAAGHLRATTDGRAAVMESDISLISVGTPSKPTGEPSLSAIKAVSSEIGEAIEAKGRNHTVVVRSTVLPGTTDKHLIPRLEAASGRRVGDGLEVCYNPEFLREGSSVRDFHAPPFTIVGSSSQAGRAAAVELYAGIDAPMLNTEIRTAESVKYLCNAFHAVKIAFANEAGALLNSTGTDAREALQIFCEDRTLNISTAYLRPGFAFGGSCLPKDLRGLLWLAKEQNIDLPFLGNLLNSNRSHIDRAFDLIANGGRRKVALFGLAFKPGTDDLRESPLVALAERLIGRGFPLSIFDRYVEIARLTGANRAFIDKELPHLGDLLASSPEETLDDAEVIVVGHADPEARKSILAAAAGRTVVDLQGVSELETLAGIDYHGICW